MEIKTLDHISGLSKLNFTEEEKQKFSSEMDSIIALMDKVREIDVTYDDTKDGNEICFADVRNDVAESSFDTEKLLSNTESRDNCYAIPKMME